MEMQTLKDQAACIGKSIPYLLSRLQINVPAVVEMMRQHLSQYLDSSSERSSSLVQ
jgi:hypothetical protein